MSTVPNEGPANTSDTPVCGLAGTRADVRCNGPVIWRVIYYRGEGSHRAQVGRIESVCFGHADYEERWTRAARMVTYARMELAHGSVGEAAQLRKASTTVIVGNADDMLAAADVNTSSWPELAGEFPRLEHEWRETDARIGEPIALGMQGPEPWNVDMERMRRKVATGKLIEANGRPFTADDCTHGYPCPVHPKTTHTHNYDPACGRRDIHEPHEFITVVVDASPLFHGGSILGADIGRQAGDEHQWCDGGRDLNEPYTRSQA